MVCFRATLTLLFMELVTERAKAQLLASPYYNFVVAVGTDSFESGGLSDIFSEIKREFSFNEHGDVAFVGRNDDGGESIIRTDRKAGTLVPIAPVVGEREYTIGSLTNDNRIIAQDKERNSFGEFTRVRVWTSFNEGNPQPIAVSGQGEFESIFGRPDLNNKNGTYVFLGIGGPCGASTCMVAGKSSTLSGEKEGEPDHHWAVNPPVHPMIAESGHIVFRRQNKKPNIFDIRTFTTLNRQSDVGSEVATHDDFARLGEQPGISRDGTYVAFYGELHPSRAADLSMEPGPAIFISLPRLYNEGRAFVQVAALQTSNEIRALDADARVSVNDVRKVAFSGQDSSGRKALFSVQMSFFSVVEGPDMFHPMTEDAIVVARQDMTVDGFGQLEDVDFGDSRLNNDGAIAFWAQGGGHDAVLVAEWACYLSNYPSDKREQATYINQYDAGLEHFMPYSSSSSKCERGGNACGPSSFTMLFNAYSNAYVRQYGAVSRQSGPKTLEMLNLRSTFRETICVKKKTKVAAKKPEEKGRKLQTNKKKKKKKKKNKKKKTKIRDVCARPSLKKRRKKVCGKKSLFHFVLGWAEAKSMGYTVHYTQKNKKMKEWLDYHLDNGWPALVSTVFTSNPWGERGRGHVVLFWGRTGSGDYIVSDPAGNYFESRTNHYGAGKCGEFKIYDQELVTALTFNRHAISPIVSNPLPNETPAQRTGGRRMQSTPQPQPRHVLCVVAHFPEGKRASFNPLLELANGQHAGILPGGEEVNDIDGAFLLIEPLATSDPDESEIVFDTSSPPPQSISIIDPPNDVTALVHGLKETTYVLDVTLFFGGEVLSQAVFDGTVGKDETILVDLTSIINIPSVKTDRKRYASDEDINVAFFDASGDVEDRVGIFPSNSPEDSTPLLFQRLRGETDGTVTFNASDLSDGDYEARMQFGGSTNVQARSNFVIQTASTLTAGPSGAPQVTTSWPTPSGDPETRGVGASLPGMTRFGLGGLTALDVSADGTLAAIGGERGGAALVEVATGEVIRYFDGHESNTIYTAMFSPNGVHVLTAGEDSTMRLWNTVTGNQDRIFVFDEIFTILSARFTPDGAHIVAAGSGRSARAYNTVVWAVDSGEITGTLDGHTGPVTSVAVSIDGSRVATGGDDGNIRLWNTADWSFINMLTGHMSAIDDLQFGSGHDLVSASGDGTVRLWNTLRGGFQQFSRPLVYPACVALSNDRSTILIGATDGGVHLFDVTSGDYITKYDGHTAVVNDVRWIAANGALSVSGDGTIREWGFSNREITFNDSSVRWITELAISPDSALLFTGSPNNFGNAPRLWDVASQELTHTFSEVTGVTSAAAFNHNSSEGFTASGNSWYHWDLLQRVLIDSYDPSDVGVINVLDVSANSSLVAIGGSGGAQLYVRNAGNITYNATVTITGFANPVAGIAFSPNGNWLALATYGATHLYDSATGEEIAVNTHTPRSSINGVGFTPDGQTVVIGSTELYLWNVSNDSVRRIGDANIHVRDLGSSGGTLAFTNRAGSLVVADVNTGHIRNTLTLPLSEKYDGVDVSADGNTVVAGTDKGNIFVLDALTGALRTSTVGGHHDNLSALAMTRDGAFVVVGGVRDSRAIVYDTKTRSPVTVFHGDTGRSSIESAAFSPDGVIVALGGTNGLARIYDRASGAILRSLQHSDVNERINGVRFSSDGQYVVTGGSSNQVYLWEVATGEMVDIFVGHTAAVNDVDISRDNAYIASASNDDSVLMFNVANGAIYASFSHTSDVVSVEFSRDGSRLLTVSVDDFPRLWDLTTFQPIQTFENTIEGVDNAGDLFSRQPALTVGHISANGRYVVTGDEKGQTQLWDVTTGHLIRVFEGQGSPVVGVAIERKNRFVVVATSPSSASHDIVVKHDMAVPAGWMLEGTIDDMAEGYKEVAISPNGRLVAGATCDRSVKLWDATTTTLLNTFTQGPGVSRCFSFAKFLRDNVSLLLGSDSEVGLYNTETFQREHRFAGHPWVLRDVAISPNGSRIATAGGDIRPSLCAQRCGSAKVYDAQTGQLLQTIFAPRDLLEVRAVAFANNHILLVAAGGLVEAWDTTTGQSQHSWPQVAEATSLLAASPTGNDFVQDSHEKLVLLRDFLTGSILHTFTHPDKVRHVGYDPTGQWLATAAGHNVYIWNVSGGLVTVLGSLEIVYGFEFSADGRELIIAGGTNGDDSIYRWAVSQE